MHHTFTTDALTWLQAVRDPCSCKTSGTPSYAIRRALIERLEAGGSLMASFPMIGDLRHLAGFHVPWTARPIEPCCALRPHEISRLQQVIHTLTWFSKSDQTTCAIQNLGELIESQDQVIRRMRSDLVAAEIHGVFRSKEHQAFSQRYLAAKWHLEIPDRNQKLDQERAMTDGIRESKARNASYDEQLWQSAISFITPHGTIPASALLLKTTHSREEYRASEYRNIWTDLHLILLAAEQSAIVITANPDLSILGLYADQAVLMIPPSNEEDRSWSDLEAALHRAWQSSQQSLPEDLESEVVFENNDPDGLTMLIAKYSDHSRK